MSQAIEPDELAAESVDEPQLVMPVEPTEDEGPVARIVDFSVGTESVVATATVVTDDATRRIEVDWGDGEEDVINHRPGFLVRNGDFRDDSLPEGTYQLYHAYDGPEDGRSFEHTVLVRVDDVDGGVDFAVRRITLSPRYRVTHYPLTVRLDGPCDSLFESANEFEIKQVVGGDVVNEWDWDPSNNFFGPSQNFRLEGSGVTREFDGPFAEDGTTFESLSFDFTEKDPISNDKGRVSAHLTLDSRGYDGYFAERIERYEQISDKFFGGCEIIYSYTKEMELLVPLPTNDRAVFSDEFA